MKTSLRVLIAGLGCVALPMLLAGLASRMPVQAQPAPVAASSPASMPASASAPAVFAVDTLLPPVTLGRVYPPLPLVRSGAERYSFEASAELAPSGLVVGPGAVLQGQARGAGTFRFRLTVRERDNGALVATLPFTLRVRAPAPPRSAAVPASVAASTPAPAPAANPVAAAPEPAQALYWRLAADDLQPLFDHPDRPDSLLARCLARPTSEDEDPTAACEAEAQAALALARAWLQPMEGRPYPTEALFLAALRNHVDPQRPGLADLLGETALLALARRSMALADALRLRWQGDGCGCGPVGSESLTYGLFPFWAAGNEVLRVDFSAFARIGVQGLFLRNDGGLVPHEHWNDSRDDGLRVAQRHATRLDLVLFRQTWGAMLEQDEERLAQAAERAATQAVGALEDSRMNERIDKVARALQWPWRPPAHLYDGLTLWLDYTPQAAPGAPPTLQDQRFQRFATTLVDHLITRMRTVPRNLALHLVVPSTAMGDAHGPWSVPRLLKHIKAAEATDPAQPAQQAVSLRVLALLAEPIRPADWALRSLLQASDALNEAILQRAQVNEYRTLDVLTSVLMPVTLVPPRVPAAAAPEGAMLKKRLADHDWQFGGVALWPLPQSASAPEPMAHLMHQSLRGDARWRTAEGPVALAVCPWICPHRAPLRMAFLGLGLLGVVALGLYVGHCRVAALGWSYVGSMAAAGTLVAVLGMALLTCDPELHALRESNLPLALLLVLLLGGTMLVAFQRREAKP